MRSTRNMEDAPQTITVFSVSGSTFSSASVAWRDHLHPPEPRDVHVPAPNHGEGIGGVEVGRSGNLRDGLLAGVDEIWILFPYFGKGSDPQQSVLRLENDGHPPGDVVGHQGGHPDPQIDVEAVPKLQRRPSDDAFSARFAFHSWCPGRWRPRKCQG